MWTKILKKYIYDVTWTITLRLYPIWCHQNSYLEAVPNIMSLDTLYWGCTEYDVTRTLTLRLYQYVTRSITLRLYQKWCHQNPYPEAVPNMVSLEPLHWGCTNMVSLEPLPWGCTNISLEPLPWGCTNMSPELLPWGCTQYDVTIYITLRLYPIWSH